MSHREIKCLVWDLDNTLWNGILAEGDSVALHPDARTIIETLDRRGIVQSIASRNDPELALEKLEELGLADFFLFPQIHWGPKSGSLKSIAEDLNIDPGTIAFIDDQPFERDEVAASLPEVKCVDASELPHLLQLDELNPEFVTVDSARRRSMYQAEVERRKTEATLPPEKFLRSLNMVFTIAPATESDLDRIEELTARTSQLNSTGRTFSIEELEFFLASPTHTLLIAGLDDVYGTYGKIGMALVEHQIDEWHLELLLMSCRVMSRGVGTSLLTYVLQQAAAEGKVVRADFVRTDRNRMMYLTFKLSGFQEIERSGEQALLEHDLKSIEAFPDHIEVRLPA